MRAGWFVCGVVLAALVLSGPGAHGAAEKKGGHPPSKADPHGKADSKAADSGLPEFLRWAADLTVWTIVVFLLLLFLLSKLAWKPMLEGLDKRERAIAAAVEESHRAREEASRLRADIERERQQAADKVRQMFDEARRDAQRLVDEERSRAKSEIQAERDRLHRELNTARDQALQQMWEQSAQLATLVAAKAIRRELTDTDQRGLLEEALAEMKGAVSERRAFTGTRA